MWFFAVFIGWLVISLTGSIVWNQKRLNLARRYGVRAWIAAGGLVIIDWKGKEVSDEFRREYKKRISVYSPFVFASVVIMLVMMVALAISGGKH